MMMQMSSSSDELREEDSNGELPFDMELSGLHLGEKQSPQSSPWRAQNASVWAAGQNLNGVYARLLQKVTSFDLVPESGKLVVLDVALSVQVAFQALRENGIKSAPLWDSEERQFVGMVSISDFVEILLTCYKDATAQGRGQADAAACDAYVQREVQRPLSDWRERLHPIPHLIFVTPEDSVYECSTVMLQHNIHRVAVLDSDSHTVLYLLTHSVILNYFLAATTPVSRVPYFGKTLAAAGLMDDPEVVGRVPCAMLSTPFVEVLRNFSVGKCSAVPIVDRDGRMVAVVTKSDIRGLVNPGIWSAMNQSVGELLTMRYRGKAGPDIASRVVTPADTLEMAIAKLVGRDVYRLFILDHQSKLVGKLTLTRLVRYVLAVR